MIIRCHVVPKNKEEKLAYKEVKLKNKIKERKIRKILKKKKIIRLIQNVFIVKAQMKSVEKEKNVIGLQGNIKNKIKNDFINFNVKFIYIFILKLN